VGFSPDSAPALSVLNKVVLLANNIGRYRVTIRRIILMDEILMR
jgi:hypothetical protein